jgi:hypothetical protein
MNPGRPARSEGRPGAPEPHNTTQHNNNQGKKIMKRLYATSIPVIAVLAFVVAPSSAFATVTIQHSTGTKEALKSTNPIEGSSSNLVFEFEKSKTNTLKCEENKISGQVVTNGTDPATAKLTAASFTNKGGAKCSSSVLGEVTVKAENLPWLLSMTATKKEGTVKSEAAGSSITFVGVFPTRECTYSASAVAFKFNTKEAPLTFTISEQRFNLTASKGSICPEFGDLNGTFTITSNGEALEAITS